MKVPHLTGQHSLRPAGELGPYAAEMDKEEVAFHEIVKGQDPPFGQVCVAKVFVHRKGIQYDFPFAVPYVMELCPLRAGRAEARDMQIDATFLARHVRGDSPLQLRTQLCGEIIQSLPRVSLGEVLDHLVSKAANDGSEPGESDRCPHCAPRYDFAVIIILPPGRPRESAVGSHDDSEGRCCSEEHPHRLTTAHFRS